VIDGVVPPRPHHGDIFINQFLLLLEFPLDDTVQCRGATRDDEPFAEESVFHRLLQPYHVRQPRDRTDAAHQRHVGGEVHPCNFQ
jgi:hypothetical protein